MPKSKFEEKKIIKEIEAKDKKNLKPLYFGLIIIILFIVGSIIAQRNIDYFESLLGNSILGMSAYIILMIIETVLAPITVLPIIAIASNIWGPVFTALLSVIGWTAGSVIAFWIGREYGFPIVTRFISEKKIKKIEELIPERNIFLGIVILRIIIPVDVLSYVLGMFTQLKFRTYTLATIIGVIPLSFILAYLGKIPATYQIMAALIGGVIFLTILIMSIINKRTGKRKFRNFWDRFFK